MKVVATQGFLRDPSTKQVNIPLIVKTLLAGLEPSWVVGKTGIDSPSFDDEGRTLKIPSETSFYAIRDDHEADCSCGCDGSTIITLMKPEEY